MPHSNKSTPSSFLYFWLAAITTLYGMQLLRGLLSLLVFVLRERFDWPPVLTGVLALLLFLSGGLVHWLWQKVGTGRLLWISGGGVALLRLVAQLWQGDPLVDLVLTALGMVCFLWFLPLMKGVAGELGTAVLRKLALGFLTGMTIDTTLHGAYGTYDMFWQSDWLTAVLILLFTLIQLFILQQVAANSPEEISETSWTTAVSWIGIGLFFFLQLLIFRNITWLTALTNWQFSSVFLWSTTAQLIGLFWCVWGISAGKEWETLLFAPLSLLLVPYTANWLENAWGAALVILFGNLVTAVWAYRILSFPPQKPAEQSGLRRLATSHAIAFLLFTLFAFLYYASYDISILPFPNTWLLPAALVLLLLFGQLEHLSTPAEPERKRPYLTLLLLLLLPLYQHLTWHTPTPTTNTSFPLRVMTYNIHDGFDTNGHLGMEAIAQVIESQQPDIIALQEISRGWAVNGSIDTLIWLSRRLNMPYIYGPTADPLWGNAILSRHPLINQGTAPLPTETLLLRRGFTWAELDPGDGTPITVVSTHFHHKDGDDNIRTAEAEALLQFWQGRPRTILMGDFNATPNDEAIQKLKAAGFQDVIELNGITPGYTSPSTNPTKRIDYILITPDLTAENVTIPIATSSDHLSVAATIQP
ncbi:MAG: hypothetical protein D6706_08000 [Chloroflexi bacterium]|nr:MAG: hypothetical protein D6706_08000 [Chloroflexota bacterium]